MSCAVRERQADDDIAQDGRCRHGAVDCHECSVDKCMSCRRPCSYRRGKFPTCQRCDGADEDEQDLSGPGENVLEMYW